MALTKKEQAVKDRWLTALRSGKYKQATGTLYKKGTKGFCCLGVLQHCVLNGKVEATIHDGSPKALPSQTFYKKFPELKWVRDNQYALVDMNDETRSRFSTIANFVDKNWV